MNIKSPGGVVFGRPDMQKIALDLMVLEAKPLRTGHGCRAAPEEIVYEIGEIGDIDLVAAVDIGLGLALRLTAEPGLDHAEHPIDQAGEIGHADLFLIVPIDIARNTDAAITGVAQITDSTVSLIGPAHSQAVFLGAD